VDRLFDPRCRRRIFLLYAQLDYGLGNTGMSRDVSWGLYIAQFTFLVGVAASAVMLVLPYYLHYYKAFGKITVLGEFLAVAADVMCILFVFVDLGRPARVLMCSCIRSRLPFSSGTWSSFPATAHQHRDRLVFLSCAKKTFRRRPGSNRSSTCRFPGRSAFIRSPPSFTPVCPAAASG
jgi:hypothetical protein